LEEYNIENMYRKKKMSEEQTAAAVEAPAPTSTDAQEQPPAAPPAPEQPPAAPPAAPPAPPANGNPLDTITDEQLNEFVGRVKKAEENAEKKDNEDKPATVVTQPTEELAAAEKAVEDAKKALETTPDDEAAKKALADAETKLAELKSKVGGRRRSRRKNYKKSGKKSRRQSKKGGKKHRKSTSKKGGKSKKRSQRKH
jgi:hypothetical protein